MFDDNSSLFQVFGVYDESNSCLSWDDTVEIAKMLGVKTVREIYRGKYDKDAILKAFEEYKSKQDHEVEGFVVRNASAFNYLDFKSNVGKFVRANHVTTDEHWTRNWVPNEILDGNTCNEN